MATFHASDVGQPSDTHFVAHACSSQGPAVKARSLKAARAHEQWHPFTIYAPA